MKEQSLIKHSSGYLFLLIPKEFERKNELRSGDKVLVKVRGTKLIIEVKQKEDGSNAPQL